MFYKCPICGNVEKKYIGNKKGTFYCRKCLTFKNKECDNQIVPKMQNVVLNMAYSLTKEQQEISTKLIGLINEDNNILVHAVCGAGKTEIITGVIKELLLKDKRIGIFIPRKDLVVEIGNRLKLFFPTIKFSFVYGGHNHNLNGNIVVATTHQAYLFKETFDLVIIDEIDAFPFKNNDLLNYFVKKSCKGKIVSLSATPSLDDKKNNKVIMLFKRFHGFPMPLPKTIIGSKIYLDYVLFKLLKTYKENNKLCFIYVPSIEEGKKLLKKITKKFNSVVFIHSSLTNKIQTLKQIHQKHFTFVITTTILERGVTFDNLQVIVYKANHDIFDVATLIQICGRVGRKKSYPSGDIYFLATKKHSKFKRCYLEVKGYNENM